MKNKSKKIKENLIFIDKTKDVFSKILKDNYVELISIKKNKKIFYHLTVEFKTQLLSFYKNEEIDIAKDYFNFIIPIINPIVLTKYSYQKLLAILKYFHKTIELLKSDEWSLNHIYAYLNLFETYDLFKTTNKTDLAENFKRNVITNIDKQCKTNSYTPLHIALYRKNIKVIIKLINYTKNFCIIDLKGNNLFHFAVFFFKDKSALKLLLDNSSKNNLIKGLTKKNFRQCTPLQLAFYKRNISCIKIFLRMYLPIDSFNLSLDRNLKEPFGYDDLNSLNNIHNLKNKSFNSNELKNKSFFENLKQNLFFKTDIKADIKSDIKADIKSDIKTDIKSDIKTDIKSDIKTDIKSEKLNFLSISKNILSKNISMFSNNEKIKDSSFDDYKTVNSKSDSSNKEKINEKEKSVQRKQSKENSNKENFKNENSIKDEKSNKTKYVKFNKNLINNFLEELEEIYKGGTPLHWCSEKKLIGELLQMGFDKYLNVKNINLETPLHTAIRLNRLDIAIIYFCSGKKLDQTGDFLGNTPLHVAVNLGCLNLVKLLTVFGDESLLDIKNNLGLTPRHLAAQNPSLCHNKILYALDVIGAKRCDNLNDNQSIECADGCKKDGKFNGENIYDFNSNNIDFFLTNFMANKIFEKIFCKNKKKTDYHAKNSKTKSKASVLNNCVNLFKNTRKIISSEKLIKKSKSLIISSQEQNKENELKTKNLKINSKNIHNRILCIDGGGVKGIFAVQILIELEKRLKYPLHNYFNWFSGTSTGSFIATLLSLEYKLIDIRTLYFVMKNKVFQNDAPYNEKILEDYLKRYLGNRTMDCVPNCKLTLTSTLYDRFPIQLHLFRNYPSPNELLNLPSPKVFLNNKDKTSRELPGYKNQTIWKACRASSAAPYYFNSFGSFCDGGLISNSPVLDIITEHFIYNEIYEDLKSSNYPKQEIDIIVSIGCGQTNVKPSNFKYDFNSSSKLSKYAKFLLQIKPFITLLISELNNTEQHKQQRTMAWCKSLNIPYVRLSTYFDKKIKLDECDNEKIIDGLWKTKVYIHQKKELIDQLVSFLETIYDEKVNTRLKPPAFPVNYKYDFDYKNPVTSNQPEKIVDLESVISEVKNLKLTFNDLF